MECRVDEPALLLVRESNSVLRTNDSAKRNRSAPARLNLGSSFNRHNARAKEVRVPVHAGAFSADLFGPVRTWRESVRW